MTESTAAMEDLPNETLSTSQLRERIHRSLTYGEWNRARTGLDDLMRRDNVAATLPSLCLYERSAALPPDYRALLQDRIDACNALHLRQRMADALGRGAEGPQVTSRVTSGRYELHSFKKDIDLSAFAAARGYRLDRRESSVSSRVMRHDPTGDKIIVGRARDGHWQYFSVRDREDHGTIIDFIQNRERKTLGEVRRELRQWSHTSPELPSFARVPIEPATTDRAAVTLEVARAQVLDTHPYLEARGLLRETLASPRFRGTWRQAAGPHGNVIFLHYDDRGLSGFEVKNRDFTGFSKGGRKGMWSSVALPSDQRLVITESAIDALSHHQVNPHPRTRYVSLGGEQNPGQPGLLDRAMSSMPAGSAVVAATDNDKVGHAFAAGIAELCAKHPHVTFERHAPSLGKDWNEHLQVNRSRARTVPLEPAKNMGLER